MNKIPFIFILPLLFASCSTSKLIGTTVMVYPSRPLAVSESDRILVGNVYNVNGEHYRDTKEELFKRLLNNAVDDMAFVLKKNTPASVEPEHGLIRLGLSPDSTVEGIMQQKEATHALLIKNYNAWFDQTNVEVVKDENGKSRTAYYDIVVDMRYEFWRNGSMLFDTLITTRRFHSSRPVLSGLLAAGPSIVSNADDARANTRVNVDFLMKTFFQLEEDRVRLVFSRKEFEKVGMAIDRGDFDAAFAESEKLISFKDRKIKSQGYYNCAVLLERRGEYEKARLYLEEALKIYPLHEANSMMADYNHLPR